MEKSDILALASSMDLSVDEKEAELLCGLINERLELCKPVFEADFGAAEPLFAPPAEVFLRDDNVSPSLSQDDALMNAEKTEQGMFTVPKTVE